MSLFARIATLAQRDAMTAAGIALSVAWMFLVALFWLLSPGDGTSQGGLSRLATAIATVLPLALIWIAVSTARALAILRAEAEDLRHRLAEMRESGATRGAPARPSAETAALSEPERPSRPPSAPSGPAPARPLPRAPSDPRTQPARPNAAPAVAVDAETLIRALNFPDGPDDAEAITALRQALQDPDHARVLRAAQDVVTLLAGQDLYMDDLPPDPAQPAVWRRFAQGARGSAVAQIGGIHDGAALDTAARLLEADEIFRDTAHHFLRHFDSLLTRQVPEMDDAQIAVMAQTRSARAFMLLGRIAGLFG